MVCAILIHDSKPLQPPVRRTAFGDVDNTCIEIAGFACYTLVDCVRDNMGDPAPVRRHSRIGVGDHLLFGKHVPQPEFNMTAPFGSKLTAPCTSACALIRRQSPNRGSALKDTLRWIKAALSIGANRPERSRLAATTAAISLPICALSALFPVNSEIATGSGSIFPCVISILNSARDGPVAHKTSSRTGITHRQRNREWRNLHSTGQSSEPHDRPLKLFVIADLHSRSLGLKVMVIFFQDSYFSGGKSLPQLRTARRALSAALRKNPSSDLRFWSTICASRTVPSAPINKAILINRSSAFFAPCQNIPALRDLSSNSVDLAYRNLVIRVERLVGPAAGRSLQFSQHIFQRIGILLRGRLFRIGLRLGLDLLKRFEQPREVGLLIVLFRFRLLRRFRFRLGSAGLGARLWRGCRGLRRFFQVQGPSRVQASEPVPVLAQALPQQAPAQVSVSKPGAEARTTALGGGAGLGASASGAFGFGSSGFSGFDYCRWRVGHFGDIHHVDDYQLLRKDVVFAKFGQAKPRKCRHRNMDTCRYGQPSAHGVSVSSSCQGFLREGQLY